MDESSTGSSAGMRGGQVGVSARDRVHAAAERISAERRPTVSTVRAEAGVSNADATRFLKEWNEERLSAHRTVAAAPPALLEQASRLAGACWAEASAIAAERHAGVEAVWAQESRDRDVEVAELVADLDRAAAEKDGLVAEFNARITGLEEQLKAQEEEVQQARSTMQAATQDAADAARDLVAARTQVATLQSAYDALLERITMQAPPIPPAPGAPEKQGAPEGPDAESSAGDTAP